METLNPTQTTHQKQVLDVQEVKAITGHSVTTIYKYVKEGIFPQPKKCGRSTRWRLADIMEYVNS
ncbi:helix-turn-helix domain-containing protein [Glaesserella parasuis]|uniref:helix-turn-helix transcriptional regulator n=1 Tax=Glaesserella parasuis TaxID=738 RepID=UPI002436DFCE|nr:helix-turn-helix domain-containing protein [Glaesserella parasuis]MDG6342402.1 helix-turn-helix domain-containing protein [Glaesserella parasuis]MDG6368561.1 helix-turn-helix domain-containing protein [Glaesserella parasuis]